MTMSSFALARKEFNPATIRGSGCMLNSYPVGCGSGTEDEEDYIKCERDSQLQRQKEYSESYLRLFSFAYFCCWYLLHGMYIL